MHKVLYSLPLLILLYVKPTTQKSHIRSIIDTPLRTNDQFLLEGTFLNRRAEVRLISDKKACPKNIQKKTYKPFCQPLVLAFKPQRRQMTLANKGSPQQPRSANDRDDHSLGVVSDQQIQYRQKFRLKIYVDESSYTITLNGKQMRTIRDDIGHNTVIEFRCYGAEFTDFSFIPSNEPIEPADGIDARRTNEPCGTTPGLRPIRARIVNGRDAKPGEFPWQVALRRKFAYPWANYKHLCGGSLIAPCWVVTAAHCVQSVKRHKDEYVFRVGDLSNSEDAASDSEREAQQDFNISEVIVHPNYSVDPSLQNDIALVRLQRHRGKCAVIGDFVRPICLPNNEQFTTEKTCVISGWGAQNWTMDPLDYPHVLQKGRIKIVDKARCRNLYGLSENGRERVSDKTVCAAERGIDSCQGDSGGPLACEQIGHQKRYFVLWGITSWGDGCANFDRPGIYTKVADFVEWIRRHVDT